jgi:hypothetical protein
MFAAIQGIDPGLLAGCRRWHLGEWSSSVYSRRADGWIVLPLRAMPILTPWNRQPLYCFQEGELDEFVFDIRLNGIERLAASGATPFSPFSPYSH